MDIFFLNSLNSFALLSNNQKSTCYLKTGKNVCRDKLINNLI